MLACARVHARTRMHASPGQEKVEMQLRGASVAELILGVSVMGTWSGYGVSSGLIVIAASFILMRC